MRHSSSSAGGLNRPDRRRRYGRLAQAAAASLILVFAAAGEARTAAPSPPPRGDEQVSARPDRAAGVALANGQLRRTVARLQAGQPAPRGVDVVAGRVRVEILLDGDTAAVRGAVASLGGTVEGDVPGQLVQALVPFGRLVALEKQPGVRYLRPPLVSAVPQAAGSVARARAATATLAVVGQEVSKTNADDWHAAGHTGSGVRVGIIDYFGNPYWSNAQTAGEVPAPAGTFCRLDGDVCDVFDFGERHGVAVAEIVHEMAPDAQLYIATAFTTADHQAAIDFFNANGVDVVTRSLTSEYDGPGDGTGPMATVLNNAVGGGMVFFNSAGNSAGQTGVRSGSYYRRTGFVDTDADGWHEFSGGDELMAFNCGFVNGLRWNDWAGGATDYDVGVFDNAGDSTFKAVGVNDQTLGAPPLEHIDLNCAPGGEVDWMGIFLFNAGNGTGSDVLEFMTNGTGLEYWQNPFSAGGPASDTASPGGLAIGAIDPATGTTIANYSSQGPTNDSRTKPDLSAASCVNSFSYAPGCFNGTSAASPVAAGAAALVLDAGLASTPAQVKTYLLNNATVDRGASGIDNVYGKGELVLPAPPTPDPEPTFGFLRVTTNPAVPSQILVDGIPTDRWGLTWMKIAPGAHTVAFGDVTGYTTPLPQAIVVTEGATTTVTGNFTARGTLRVLTNPAVPGTISIDGFPRNDWGFWSDIPAGSHEVCFGPVEGFATPPCQTTVLGAGGSDTITGNYSPGTPGAQAPFGFLRVTTNPALPSQIVIDGIPTDRWGLTWVKVPPGAYTVSFTDVTGYTTPAPQAIVVNEGATTVVTGNFVQRGTLRVLTNPAVPGTISVDGIPRNDWGFWADLPAGAHEVCFGNVDGFTAPPCQNVNLVAGDTTTVTGNYTS